MRRREVVGQSGPCGKGVAISGLRRLPAENLAHHPRSGARTKARIFMNDALRALRAELADIVYGPGDDEYASATSPDNSSYPQALDADRVLSFQRHPAA